jgi:uncharacterized protein (TIGR02217 family)
MSNAIFPTLPGLTWDLLRTPVWSTTKKISVSQREYRIANMAFPRYKYKLSFEFLRQTNGFTEFTTLTGFFNARQGGFDSFLFQDPDDYTVTAQTIGVGNGSNKLFQLVRTWGGCLEPVYDANSAPLIYLDGTLKTLTTDYTVSATGLVTFVTAPGAGVVVTWTGNYYRRVCFTQDMADFNKFMTNLWSLKTLEFITVMP